MKNHSIKTGILSDRVDWWLMGLPVAFLVQILFFSQLHLDWWLEDDPNLFVLISQVTQPLDIFFVRDLASVNGHYFTPLQLLSFWVDHQLSPGSAGLAYGHTLLSFIAAQALFFVCLRRFTGTKPALAAAVLWIFLPTTIAVTEWVSARHYLEGLVLLMVAFVAAEKGTRERTPASWAWCVLAIGCFFASALAKELYVISGWWLLTCLFWWRGAKTWIPVLSVFLVLYFGYRYWAVEAFEAVGQQPLSLDHLWILPKLPYVFSGNPGGYGLFALVAGFAAYGMFRGKIGVRQGLFWVSQWGLALATIFPVAGHLSEQFQSHGSWYRLGFLLNTLLLAGGVWVVSRAPKTRGNPVFFLAALVCLMAGAWITAKKWDVRKSRSEAEGRFYLEHPDRLLYSQTPGNWFLAGLHNLYSADQPVHFIAHRQREPNVFLRLKRFEQVWEQGATGFQIQPSLHRTLWVNAALGRNPLHLRVDGLDGLFLQRMAIPRDPASALQIQNTTLLVSPMGYERTRAPRRHPLALANQHQLVFLEKAGEAWGLVLANAGSGENRLRLSGFDGQGAALEIVELTLEPGQMVVKNLKECFNGSHVDMLRRVEVHGREPLLACLFQREGLGEYQIYEPVQGQSRESFTFAHIPSGPNWLSELVFFNGGRENARVALTTFGKNKPKLGETLEMRPGEVRNYRFKDETGSAVIETSIPGLVFWQNIHMTGEGSGSHYQSLQPAASRLVLPASQGEEAWRALVLFNGSDKDSQVVLRGTPKGTPWQRIIKANAKIMVVLPSDENPSRDQILEATTPLNGLLIFQELRGRLNTVELKGPNP